MATIPLDIEAATYLDSLCHDPLQWVCAAFPWGRELTWDGQPNPLQHAPRHQPDAWQAEVLRAFGASLQSGETGSYRQAIASGHGVGKTALLVWLILFWIATRQHPQIVVTAGTGDQLRTKTWRELAYWHHLFVLRDYFTWTAERYYHVQHQATWFASAITWSKERAQSFAGTHAEYVLVIFDEASTIDEAIWEVTEGAMSTPGACWFAFGNPERNTGHFREVFPGRRFARQWQTRHIDSRTCALPNKTEIAEQIAAYGEDSDFVRVRWRGEFPQQAATQFLADDLVEDARRRDYAPEAYSHAAVILGVDCAREGDDESVHVLRQGLKALWLRAYRHLDTMEHAAMIGALLLDYPEIDAVVIEEVGIGTGTIDRLRQLGHGGRVHGVKPGAAPVLDADKRRYFNLRAEMWGKCREWLVAGGQIPDDAELAAQLTAPLYGYSADEKLQIERKLDLKRRGYTSPDRADGLVLTFAIPVQKQGVHTGALKAHGYGFHEMTRGQRGSHRLRAGGRY